MDRIKRWETKMMMRLFRFKRGTDETWVEFHARCCTMARKMWTQMGMPFLYEIIAESMCDPWDGYVIRDQMQSSLP